MCQDTGAERQWNWVSAWVSCWTVVGCVTWAHAHSLRHRWVLALPLWAIPRNSSSGSGDAAVTDPSDQNTPLAKFQGGRAFLRLRPSRTRAGLQFGSRVNREVCWFGQQKRGCCTMTSLDPEWVWAQLEGSVLCEQMQWYPGPGNGVVPLWLGFCVLGNSTVLASLVRDRSFQGQQMINWSWCREEVCYIVWLTGWSVKHELSLQFF